MTASALTQLPLMAGSALLSTAGRGAAWTFSRYMRAPLASTGLLAMVTLTALAGSNALYFQTAQHPSPFFAPAPGEVQPLPTPSVERPVELVTPAEPVATLPALSSQPVAVEETTGSVTTVVPDAPVGNEKMFAVQKKLLELQLFSGAVDGYYGPKTAEAIRAFETRNGMTATGSMNEAVLDAILASDGAGRIAAAPQPQAAAQPAPSPQPAPVQQVATQVATDPQPVASIEPEQDRIVGRVPGPSLAEQAFDNVAQSAHNTIDSIIAGLDGGRGGANAPVANAPVPTANVAVAQTQPMPPVMQPMIQQVAAVTQIVPAAQTAPVVQTPAPAPTTARVPPANDTELVTQIQRGLASLGFFRAPVDGKPGPETARAIREFENFHRYKMTGQVQPDLVDLLLKAGATI